MKEEYVIKKSPIDYQDIVDGRQNTMSINKGMFQPGEHIRFIEVRREKKKTGRECWAEVERLFNGTLLKFRVVKAWNSQKL